MGGYGSGPQWGGRPLVEHALVLNIGELQRGGVIAPGNRRQCSLHWPGIDGADSRASVALVCDVHDDWGRLMLSYSIGKNERPVDCEVQLSSVDYAWGGRRWYFHCPLSGRRVSKLHIYPALSDDFASREALGLAYLSQRQSPGDRAAARLASIKASLRGRGINPEARRPRRPRRMHRRTFRRLLEERWAAEVAWEEIVLMPLFARGLGLR